MIDAEEVLWTAETVPTPDGIDALCRSFSDRLAELLLPPKVGQDLGLALAGLGTNVAGQHGSATRVVGELKRRNTDLTLTLADDGTPLQRPAHTLQAVAARFPAKLYVPRGALAPQAVNRFVIRTGTPEAPARPRVLVVDDDPVQRMALALFLRESYAAVACATAAEAELEARLQRPDVIISDIHMPEDDGLAFRDRLAREPALGTIPFLFLTCDRSPGAVAAANETGIDDLIYKPLDKRKLLAVLDRILRRQAQLKALRRRGSELPSASAPPERHGGYTLATRRRGMASSDGPMLWHRDAGGTLQLLMCEAADGTSPHSPAWLGFVKGAVRGIDAAHGPAGFLDLLTQALSEDGLLDEADLIACACWLDPSGAIRLAEHGPTGAVLIGVDGPRRLGAAPDLLAPGERLALCSGLSTLPELPAGLFGQPPSAVADRLVQHLQTEGGEHDLQVCVIGFD